MLRITPAAGIQRAKDYFTESLDRGDYYLEGQELAGVWGGKLAAALGLAGAVAQKEFFQLCENRHPVTGKPLTPKTLSNRRVGYDINYHPPKSLSLQYGIAQDPEILAGFEEAVDYAMGQLEADVQTRVRKGGANYDRTTGNLLWSKFTHLTARPVGGVPDMHIHSHVFTFNVTHDAIENHCKAIQLGNVKREGAYYEALFHSRLRQNMEEAGYRTRTSQGGKSFELAHVTDPMIASFSRRTRDIEAIAQAQGITAAARKAEIGARTREKKAQSLTLQDLRPLWRSRLTPAQLEVIARAKSAPRSKTWMARHGEQHAKEAIAFAREHSFERDSVVREKALLATALKHSQGMATREQLVEQLGKLDYIKKQIDGIDYLTTKELLVEEQRLVEFARQGVEKYGPFSLGEHFSLTRLSPSQQLAARAILASEDQVSVLRGVAGSGKTFLMQQVVQEIEQSQGGKVLVTAPSIDAAEMLKKEGFPQAQTIQRLLIHTQQHPQLKNGTLWIDEIGLVGTRTMGQIFELAQQQNTRLILTGDETQHSSVLRGSPLKLLRDHGIAPVELTEIRRQQGEYQQIVHHLSQGKLSRAYADLDRLGWVKELEPKQAYQQIAAEFRRSVVGNQSSIHARPLAISPTHQEKERLTEAIRAELWEARWLSGTERTFACLQSVELTEAERKLPCSYQPGRVVCFYQNMHGFQAGSRAVVKRVDARGNVWMHRPGQPPRALNLDQGDRFDVYAEVERKLARGDPICITHQGKTKNQTHALRSGSEYEVKGFDGEDIVLMNDWVVRHDYGHWDHAYVKTSHAAQGKTTKKVLIAQQAGSLANNAEQFYVSVSRAKQEATIFTDDKQKLAEEIQKTERFKNAADLGHVAEQQSTLPREIDDARKRKAQPREPGL
ncbi:MobF family relaxase [Bythopirellula goksoeyrii]|uniref:Multifunctional conjugation protein TraI n=1 Tax=Bythopirellula goksoeyrii TaxID=1400387 RepID=A0A5B9QPV0_9BACT|nr:MobF family relaxase [Bythopirellula goksoeyrii]QEG36161.1 Multifunctional conjugation protein TraI [Bythopirellula goksoeyrii]